MALSTASLNASVNALLAIRDGYDFARWNILLAAGTSDTAPGGLGQAISLTYGFPAALNVPAYATNNYDPETDSGSNETAPVAFTALQATAAVEAMARIAEVTRVSFSAAGSSAADIDFRACLQGSGSAAYGYYPSFDYSTSDTSDVIVEGSIVAQQVAGDVWLNSQVYGPADSLAPGSDGFATLLHELGHALGLKHPFENDFGGPMLADALDTTRHTVMSYSSGTRMTLMEVTLKGNGYSYITYDLSPRTLMPLDIAALQVLYGANMVTRSGGTTYQWAPGEIFMETIWDGGGTDTIDCSNQALRCVIDLTPGNYSSIALRETSAQLRAAFNVPDAFQNSDLPPDLYNGSNNLAIAYNVFIENAIGGAGNDSLIGNSRTNILTGGAGNDTYLVQNVSDQVVELAGKGTDLIQVRCAYTLPDNVENGSIVVGTNINLDGNALANTLTAGAGANSLDGKGGSDTVSYATATKAVKVSLALTSAQDTLGSGLDLLTSIESLVGSAYNDTLTGSSAANRLEGGTGTDSLVGGGGADSLLGGAGSDSLAGGTGLDQLTGGLGTDVFRFDVTPNTTTSRDTLLDFNVTDDTIQLENSVFTALVATGTLDKGSLRSGAGIQTAGDTNDFLLYNSTTGALFYDADGSATAKAPIQLAVLTGVPSLTNLDFVVT